MRSEAHGFIFYQNKSLPQRTAYKKNTICHENIISAFRKIQLVLRLKQTSNTAATCGNQMNPPRMTVYVAFQEMAA